MLGHPLRRGEGKVHLVGGGIAGLLAGYYLKKAGVPFVLYEQSNRVGGMLNTTILPEGIAEHAANGFLPSASLLALAKEVGIALAPPKDTAKARYLVRNGLLTRFPLGVWEAASMFGRLLVPHRTPLNTLADFGNTYLGSVATEYLLSPAIGGIYGAPLQELSVAALFPKLSRHLEGSGWLPSMLWSGTQKKEKTPRGTHSAIGGMGSLCAQLGSYLADHIVLNTDGIGLLKGSNACVVLCTPAYRSANFFEGGQLSDKLRQVQYRSFVSVTILMERSHLPRFKDGFGCLIARKEGFHALGYLFNSSIFDGRVNHSDWVSLTAILRDDSGVAKQLLGASDEHIVNLINEDLVRLFGYTGGAWINKNIARWQQGIPVYSPDLYQTWHTLDETLKTDYPQVRLFGNYTGQISIRGMNDAMDEIIGTSYIG